MLKIFSHLYIYSFFGLRLFVFVSGMAGTENRTKSSPSPNAKRRRNEPLKAVNTGANSPLSSTPRCPKPRQSLLPPKGPAKSRTKF